MATKIVYQTDNDQIFIYETLAHELALAPGQYNIPYGAYEDAPPAVAAGQCARRTADETAWEVVEDHRSDTLYLVDGGAQYSRGSVVEVDGLDVSYPGWGPVPAWLTDVAPTPAPLGDGQDE